jgi:acyl carrier protein
MSAPTPGQLRELVLQALHTIVPEADPAEIDPDTALRVQLDIDSMDALNFFIRLHEKLGVDIPERDYGRLTTLNECVAYLAAKLGPAKPHPGDAVGEA